MIYNINNDPYIGLKPYLSYNVAQIILESPLKTAPKDPANVKVLSSINPSWLPKFLKDPVINIP